jgi:hypothetical protein
VNRGVGRRGVVRLGLLYRLNLTSEGGVVEFGGRLGGGIKEDLAHPQYPPRFAYASCRQDDFSLPILRIENMEWCAGVRVFSRTVAYYSVWTGTCRTVHG